MMTASLVVELRLESTRTSVVATGGPHSTGSVVVAHQAELLCGMWDLPGLGIEPVSLCWQADS